MCLVLHRELGKVMFYVFVAVVWSDGVHGYGAVEYSYVSVSV